MPDTPVLHAPDTRAARSLLEWGHQNLSSLSTTLRDAGVVLLRGFHTPEPDTAQRILALLGAQPMDNVFWSTPRRHVRGHTFTATEYPPRQHIPLHSEMSYHRRRPRLLVFHALERAASGGQTTLADLDAVSADLAALSAELRTRQVTYVRTFHPGIDIPLATAFGTDDLSQITRIAADADMTLRRTSTGAPQLTHTAQGALTDAATTRPIWFNQLHLYHPARLPQPLRRNLRQLYSEHDLPRHAYYGDGEPIPDQTVEEITDAFTAHTIDIDWEPHDIAVIDNLRYAHGRRPFTGPRRVHVAMGMPHTCTDRGTLTIPGPEPE
ncbi:TauD/TfdA family dioxygenase [Nocardia sp. NPDC003482]